MSILAGRRVEEPGPGASGELLLAELTLAPLILQDQGRHLSQSLLAEQ
jgi:hypothetical protein